MAGEHGVRLTGGNVGGAWRVADTVRRTTGPWTPAVHALLDHLAPRLPHVPAVHGFDDLGREVLTYLPGRVVDVDSEMLTDAQLTSVVRWTRRLHDAVADFSHPGPWRFFGVEEPTIVAHNDIAPYNVCFDGDELAGVFDWDLAGPSTPLMELAFIAWNCVPLWRDIGAEDSARRLELIAAAYGSTGYASTGQGSTGHGSTGHGSFGRGSTGYGSFAARDVLLAVEPRIRLVLHGIPAAAAAGDAGMANLVAIGEPERTRRALEDLLRRIPAITGRLQDRRSAVRPHS